MNEFTHERKRFVNTKTIEISFGKSLLPVHVPPGAQATVIRKHPLPKLKDTHSAIRQALDQPVRALPLKILAQGRRSACILICDTLPGLFPTSSFSGQ